VRELEREVAKLKEAIRAERQAKEDERQAKEAERRAKEEEIDNRMCKLCHARQVEILFLPCKHPFCQSVS